MAEDTPMITDLPPDISERIEKKKLKKKDKKPVEVNCLHRGPKMTHTNGSIECLQCHAMLKEVKPKLRKELK